ncbi:MAG: hypothetical protein PUA93_00815 [Eubacteriales bacterium]|nr:hypothetical protein [Eubacteriales bacterium]
MESTLEIFLLNLFSDTFKRNAFPLVSIRNLLYLLGNERAFGRLGLRSLWDIVEVDHVPVSSRKGLPNGFEGKRMVFIDRDKLSNRLLEEAVFVGCVMNSMEKGFGDDFEKIGIAIIFQLSLA